MPIAKKLAFRVTNNEAEYEACILGMEALITLGVTEVEIFGDSMLVINQATEEWELKEQHLKPYLSHLQNLTLSFQKCKFIHLPRNHNQMADALASLASVWEGPSKMPMKPLILLKSNLPSHKCLSITEIKTDNKPWFFDIQQYLIKSIYPEKATEKDKIVIRQLASKFTSHQGVLYPRTSDGVQLRCLNETEAAKVMEEVHEGVCGPHMNGAILANKLMRQGFFWMIMMEDCIRFIRKCYKRQVHGDISHLPPTELHSISPPWPFST